MKGYPCRLKLEIELTNTAVFHHCCLRSILMIWIAILKKGRPQWFQRLQFRGLNNMNDERETKLSIKVRD